MTLRKIGPGEYETRDGRYHVLHDFTLLENDCGCVICQMGRESDCPNGGHGIDRGWSVWDRRNDDYVPTGSPLAFDTLREARLALERIYA